MKKVQLSLPFIGFLQATGLTTYCGLVGLLFWKGNNIFGKAPNFAGPFLVLVLLATSVLVCALITLAYPIYIFWEKKQTQKSLKIIGFTASWLLLFIILIIVTSAISKPSL